MENWGGGESSNHRGEHVGKEKNQAERDTRKGKGQAVETEGTK